MKRPPGILLPTLGVVGGLVLVVALAILFLVNRSRADLAAYKAELEQRGEIFDVTRLAPPAPPAENNGADALVAAGTALKAALTKNSIKPYKTGQVETTPGQAEVLHRRHAALRINKDTTWEDFHKEMEVLRPLLAEIRRCAQAPVLEFQLDYTKGVAMDLPFLSPCLSSGQFLAAENLLLLRAGNTKAVAENIETLLRIAKVANNQPILISHLIAMSLVGICHASTWELLQASPSAQDLQQVQKAWESFSLIGNISELLRMERTTSSSAFLSSPDILKSMAALSKPASTSPSSLDPYIETIEWVVWSVVFRHSDERHFLGDYQELIQHLDKGGSWQDLLSLAKSQKTALEEAGLSLKLSKINIPFISDALEKLAGQAALQSLTITAIAIQRHQLDHAGQPPDSLADLVPAYLAAVPADPMTKEPLRYQRKGEHFLLYAVGGNGVDDGGDATTTPPGKRNRGPTEGLDIVWPRAVASP